MVKMENILQDSEKEELAVIESWGDGLKEIGYRIGGRFARSESREEATSYVRGLLSPVERKNSWQLAEALGEPTPYRIQHLLGRALWEADAVRDDLQQYVVDHLVDPEAILVVDETGFLKKGRHSAGVARQYSGTAGRVENCQIGVFLAYASVQGHTLVDRELYLPREWTDDPVRCAQAGIPADRSFATKPQLARQMLERAFEVGIPAAWVTGDSVYGDDRRLRLWLEEQKRAYVLAVSGKEYVWMGFQQVRVTELLADLPDDGWIQLSAGDGAKGPRWYDWLLIPINRPLQEGWRRWVLVRRKLDDPSELTAFVVFAPAATKLEMMVHVAGSRWTMELALEAAKGEVGLDHYEVRSWRGWYRHITLAMWAQALLTVLRATAIEDELRKKGALLPASTRSLEAFRHSRGLSFG
jgi:SRSO17 transposase